MSQGLSRWSINPEVLPCKSLDMAGQKARHIGGSPLASFSGNSVVIASFIIFVVSIGVNTAFGVFFKPMLNDFGWTKAMTSGAFSLSWIMNGLLGIVMGRLNDRFGPRGVITFSGALMGSGYFLMSQISALWHLYLFYGVIVGVGMSGIWVPAMSTIARLFVDKRGIITAIVMVGGGIGALAAPPAANWLISQFDWRISYIIIGSLVFFVVVLSAQFLRSAQHRLGEIHHGQYERREDGPKLGGEPFSLKEAVCTRQFWFCSGMVFWFGFCAYVIMVHIVPHATELGISAARAANILAIIGGLATLGRVVLGSVANRIGNRQVFIIGFILISAASFWLLPARKEWELCLFAAVFGFGFGAGVSNSPLIAELFGLSSHGLILGVNVLGYSIGAAAGPLVAGYLFDVTGSYQLAFLACAIAGILGLILTALISCPRSE
jgi:MFS family permease